MRNPLARHSIAKTAFRSHRTVRASRTCKSGMNNAAREIEHPILGAAESLPLLNKVSVSVIDHGSAFTIVF